LSDLSLLGGESSLESYIGVRDRLARLDAEIEELAGQKTRYLLQNVEYIFQYFEEKQNIIKGKGQTRFRSFSSSGGPFPSKSLAEANSSPSLVNAFFKLSAGADKTESVVVDKSQEYQWRYWKNVNGQISGDEFMQATDACRACSGELVQLEEEGTFTCSLCGVTAELVVDSEKPSYREPPGEISYTAYVRLNHFKEILSQFQAKETTQIPEQVMSAIVARIKKERITDKSEITYARTREILRKLGYNKYFEHVAFINMRFGVKPPVMSESLVEVLCVLFVEIQSPWSLHCPASRQNFFGYNFVLHQLCALLGAVEFLPFIPMLKDLNKSSEQDAIWQQVCMDLGWLFIPSPR
jgi:hypothetical protein